MIYFLNIKKEQNPVCLNQLFSLWDFIIDTSYDHITDCFKASLFLRNPFKKYLHIYNVPCIKDLQFFSINEGIERLKAGKMHNFSASYVQFYYNRKYLEPQNDVSFTFKM